jgi:hypothetical protein
VLALPLAFAAHLQGKQMKALKTTLAFLLAAFFLLCFWVSLKEVPTAIDHYRAGDVSGALTTYFLLLLSACLMVASWRWFKRLISKSSS